MHLNYDMIFVCKKWSFVKYITLVQNQILIDIAIAKL